MRRILLALICLSICSQMSGEDNKPANNQLESRVIIVPRLFGDGTVEVLLGNNLSPFEWAYCLDMTRGTDQEQKTWAAFDKACKADPSLMDKVAEWMARKNMIQQAKHHTRRR